MDNATVELIIEEMIGIVESEGEDALTDDRIEACCKKHEIDVEEFNDLVANSMTAATELSSESLNEVVGGSRPGLRKAAALAALLNVQNVFGAPITSNQAKIKPAANDHVYAKYDTKNEKDNNENDSESSSFASNLKSLLVGSVGGILVTGVLLANLIKSKSNEIDSLKEQLAEAESNREKISEELSQANNPDALRELKEQHERATKQVERLNAQIKEKEQEIETLKKEQQNTKSALKRSHEEKNSKSDEIAELSMQIEEKEQEIAKLKEEQENTESTLEHSREETNSKSAEIAKLSKQIKEKEQELTKLKQASQNEVETLKNNLAIKKRELQTAQENIANAKKQASDLQRSLDAAQQELTETKTSREQYHQIVTEQQSKLNSLQNDLDRANKAAFARSRQVLYLYDTSKSLQSQLETETQKSVDYLTGWINDHTKVKEHNATIAERDGEIIQLRNEITKLENELQASKDLAKIWQNANAEDNEKARKIETEHEKKIKQLQDQITELQRINQQLEKTVSSQQSKLAGDPQDESHPNPEPQSLKAASAMDNMNSLKREPDRQAETNNIFDLPDPNKTAIKNPLIFENLPPKKDALQSSEAIPKRPFCKLPLYTPPKHQFTDTNREKGSAAAVNNNAKATATAKTSTSMSPAPPAVSAAPGPKQKFQQPPPAALISKTQANVPQQSQTTTATNNQNAGATATTGAAVSPETNTSANTPVVPETKSTIAPNKTDAPSSFLNVKTVINPMWNPQQLNSPPQQNSNSQPQSALTGQNAGATANTGAAVSPEAKTSGSENVTSIRHVTLQGFPGKTFAARCDNRSQDCWDQQAYRCLLVDEIFAHYRNEKLPTTCTLDQAADQGTSDATVYDPKISTKWTTITAPRPQAKSYTNRTCDITDRSDVISTKNASGISHKINTHISKFNATVYLTNANTLDSLHQALQRSSTPPDYSQACVVNFANPTLPGGYSWWGQPSQEQSLCVTTNLLPKLCQDSNKSSYYATNLRCLDTARDMGVLNKSRRITTFEGNIIEHPDYQVYTTCIFTPDVHQLKNATSPRLNEFLPKDQQVSMNVLTIAAPSIDNTCASRLATLLDSDKTEYVNYLNLCKQQWRCILHTAHTKGMQHIVLGALGCGQFHGNSFVVSKALCEVLKTEGPSSTTPWGNCFATVSIPIFTQNPQSDYNYKAFKATLDQFFPHQYTEINR